MNQRMGDKVLWAIAIFGVVLIAAGVVRFIQGHADEGFFYAGLGFILFYLFAMIPNRILIGKDGITMQAFLRKRYIPYEAIESMSWKCTGKILASSYTGFLHMVKGGRRKIFSKDEETLKYLNEVIMRALAVGYSDRDGEVLYLR